jgi:hypothetical protein
LCGKYVVEGWRADVAVRQPGIGVVQNIEQLGAELKLLPFGHANVLEGREIPAAIFFYYCFGCMR